MLRIFNHELQDPEKFVVTLELVPHRESFGKSTDTLIGIAQDAFADGRVAAVSLTDNPGGNPSLSPDVLGHEIFRQGLDVIVHFTCRDMNRMGMESRALQLARLGIKNVLALTGDYSGKGIGGQGAPVFDLDSVTLTAMFQTINEKLAQAGDPEGFFTGCAVSPFKISEAECRGQYCKLDKKIAAGAAFVITQLGYDIQKFQALIQYLKEKNAAIPALASVYLLSPRSARAMNRGRVPGAYVSDSLFESVISEWETPRKGLAAAVERAARLGVIIKGLGYRGMHIGGIHRSFKTVAAILDRMEEIEDSWQSLLEETDGDDRRPWCWYDKTAAPVEKPSMPRRARQMVSDNIPYRLLDSAHALFFNKTSKAAPSCRRLAKWLDQNKKARLFKYLLEDPVKVLFLSCQGCGDCAIQHLAYLCPESGCPKHMRNGPCGGSRNDGCEVYPERTCVWVRAYERLQHAGLTETFLKETAPPRMWELNKTSSWINFYLEKDHHALKKP